MLLVPRARKSPAPRWLVRTGDSVVGPVATELLVRGVQEGRVPEQSLVRDERSLEWRRLEQVRELGPGAASSPAERASRGAVHLAAARDAGEVFLFLLHGAVEVTSSLLGVVHRKRGEGALLVTSCVLGPCQARLGAIVPGDDPVLRLARAGECLHGEPSAGALQQSIAERLAPETRLSGVIMVPVLYGTELVAVLELARDDHGYRQGDADSLLRLSALAVDRLEALSR